ncbi:MAG: amidase family protein, partial [Spirochaetales bacterium]
MQQQDYTVSGILQSLAQEKTTSEQSVKNIIEQFEHDKASSAPLNAFLEIYDDAVKSAILCDEQRLEAKKQGNLASLLAEKPLLGIPFAVKDNISVKLKNLTCASRVLEGYVAPYNATVVQRLIDAGAIPVGRCNQDEFAMGSSTEYSAYVATRNPCNREYVSGGSSGGSAAVVAAGFVPFSLGTETGGSVRLPASYCGIYGLKPTYGVLSRWGVVAFASALDQVGLFGLTPGDIALPLSVMVGQDFYDDTSCDFPDKNMLSPMHNDKITAYEDFSSLKIAIPRQFLQADGPDAEVIRIFNDVQEWFKSKGASIHTVDLPVLDTSIACYYVIALAEAASNLSRFDGIRYGNRKDPGEGYDELYV